MSVKGVSNEELSFNSLFGIQSVSEGPFRSPEGELSTPFSGFLAMGLLELSV